MDSCELAWAAGFFDGEGWVGQSVERDRATAQPHAQINQAGAHMPDALARFQRALGGLGRLRGPQQKPGRRDLYRWEVSSRQDVTALSELLGPLLCERKRAAFDRVLGASTSAAAPDFSQEEMLAWAAGLFDGEGSICLGSHRTHADYSIIEASVTQLGLDGGPPPELERFRAALGGLGRVYGPYKQQRASGPVYRWKVNRAVEVRQLFDRLAPFLGTVKKSQGLERLALVEAQPVLLRGNPAWGNRKSHCVNGHAYATSRLRPYLSRGSGLERRLSQQCLVCLREYARRQRDRGRATC